VSAGRRGGGEGLGGVLRGYECEFVCVLERMPWFSHTERRRDRERQTPVSDPHRKTDIEIDSLANS